MNLNENPYPDSDKSGMFIEISFMLNGILSLVYPYHPVTLNKY